MTTRIVDTEHDRTLVLRFIEGHDLPLTVKITKAGRRSVEQNRLQFLWMNEIAEQQEGWTPKDARAYCKLTMGVPILREENEEFRAKYDAIVRPLPYEQKLALMVEPLDFPITSLMNTRQMTRYLDQVQQHFAEKGYALTDPGDLLNNSQSDAGQSCSGAEASPESPPADVEGDEATLSTPSSPSSNSEALPPVDPASDKPTDTSANSEGGDRPTSPSSLRECAIKILGIAVDPLFETAQQRRTALESAKDSWKASLPETDHDALRALVSSADAIIKGQADYDAAVSRFGDMLSISADEFPKLEGA